MDELRWFVTVESQDRIRFPKAVAGTAIWLRRESLRICVEIGRARQLIIFPDTGRAALVKQALSHAAGDGFSGTSLSNPGVAALRSLASIWPCTLNYESAADRFTFTFPDDLRDLGVCPAVGERAVLLTFGDFLEVWRSEEWLANWVTAGPKGLGDVKRALERASGD